LKGAPERVIEKSKNYKREDGTVQDFTEADKKKFIEHIQNYAKEGLRVLGVGILYGAGSLADLNESNIEQKLTDIDRYAELEKGGTFLGIVCIKDPVREEVKQAIMDCKTAGIRVIMITGDSKETAVAIAKEINIIEQDGPNTSFTGSEFMTLTHE
jgi:magnesium-transporting ATPase (P-type)